MQKMYENAQSGQVWLGPNNDDHQAEVAVQSIEIISDFLCKTLGISLLDDTHGDHTYQEVLLKSKEKLPLPSETDFGTDAVWSSLVWFHSHRYFTRIWVIQEISANKKREINMGSYKTAWNRVDLVASYIIMEPKFSDEYGFSEENCWWVATLAELTMQPSRWLNMLYLASNYGCRDARDVIYGLRGLMELSKGQSLLDPDYNKSTLEVD
jgi:hypothetical protein